MGSQNVLVPFWAEKASNLAQSQVGFRRWQHGNAKGARQRLRSILSVLFNSFNPLNSR